MSETVDWSHRAEYITRKHGTNVTIANEALDDPNALVIDPDYGSKSGNSVRNIGYSETAGKLLTVITVTEDDTTYGVNCWDSNAKDIRLYNERE